MIIGSRQFKPSLWSVLLTLFSVCVFVGLGNWQLYRAAYKSAIVDKYESRLSQDYQLLRAGDDLSDIEFRRLTVSGEYDLEHSFYVDNQLYQGMPGYRVLTPFRLADSEQSILVDRGWVALGESRQQLPPLQPPLLDYQINGIASGVDTDGFRMGELKVTGEWPLVIPYIDIERLRAQFSTRLLPLVLRLAPEQPGHYIRAWTPVYDDPEKSRAYALQWFSFAVIAVFLFVMLNLRKLK